GAIDELMASGALDDAVGGDRRDDIQNELDMMSASSDVERELSRLKGEITAGAPKQLEGGANGNSQAAPQAPQSQSQGQGQGQGQGGGRAGGRGTPSAPPPPERAQRTQQAQPVPASDLPAGPQDREGS